MHWLALTILLSFGFGQLFKWSQRRGCRALVVVTTNYLVLAGLLLAYHSWRGDLSLDTGVVLVGVTMGATFLISMLTMTHALEVVDVGVVLTSFRMAILVPVFASIHLWGEQVTWFQLVGIAMALGALLLMTRKPQGHGSRAGGMRLVLAALVFGLQGLSQLCLRWVHYAGLDDQRLQVLMVTAATAGFLGLGILVGRRRRPPRREGVMGAGIGAFNLVARAVLLTTLSRMKGAVYFPLHGCAVVILDNSFAHLLWKERLTWPAVSGVAMGICAMALVL